MVDVRDLAAFAFGANDDARCIDAFDDTGPARNGADTRVARESLFHRRADQRRVRADERHGLTLHVGAHERAVRVVVLEERHERGGDRNHLVRCDVHELDHVGGDELELTVEARRDEVLLVLALVVEGSRRLRDVLALFFEGRVPLHVFRDAAAFDLAVGRLDEAVLVHACERRERRDEADIRTFRRLDRADASVVRRVDVADFEACTFARETAGPEGREAALVRDFAERVRLIHELRELARAEVLLHDGADRLRVDEIVRHQRVDLLRHAHALFDRSLHADETDAVLVLHQLADGANATVAEVVDVVDRTATVLQLDEVTNRLEDVLRREDAEVDRRSLVLRDVAVELVVQLEAADLREVVALGVEEEVLEERLRRLERGRIARAQASVDLEDRVFGRLHLVGEERVPEVRADVETVDEEHTEALDLRLAETLKLGLGELLVALDEDFACLGIDDVVRRDLRRELVRLHRETLELCFLQLANRSARELSCSA